MTEPAPSLTERLATSRPILMAYLAVAAVLVLLAAVRFQMPEVLGQEKVLTDFDAFHIAGQMAARGQAADAYHADVMLRVQQEISSTPSFMPWTYPPPFTLFMDWLSRLPIGIAFALFAAASFALYLVTLHRIAGKWLPGVLVGMMPIMLLNLRTGQNGFLTAGLIGMFLLAWRDRRTLAGLPLGLMIIKPHLAAGVGLMALLGRRWPVLAVAALVAFAALAISTWAYGWQIWPHFLFAVRQSGKFMALGYYPLFRMNSIYAALYSYGLPAPVAMAGHALGALVALGLLIRTCLSKLEFRFKAAFICALSLFVSPYSYDYDMAILGLALAFVLHDLIERCSGRELAGLLVLAWVAEGYGIGVEVLQDAQSQDAVSSLGEDAIWPALIAPVLIGLCVTACHLLIRKHFNIGHSQVQASPGSETHAGSSHDGPNMPARSAYRGMSAASPRRA